MSFVNSAAATMSDPYPIHIGTWINWSRGRIMGATLTLERDDADLLIAFTAFFIAFVATRIWRIICFALHRLYSTASPQDAMYHQRQAILRNSASPEDGARLLFELLWTNRRKPNRPSRGFLRPLFPAILALICAPAFLLAGGYSSRVSTAIGNEVLIKSANCGYLNHRVLEQYSLAASPLAYKAERVSNAANYAQQCYTDDSGGLLDCGRFVTKRIKGQMDSDAECPFDDGVCDSPTGNLKIDSGYIDSHHHLGLNAPADQRFLSRNVVHCAPLATQNFTSLYNTSQGDITRYHYGSTYGDSGLRDFVLSVRSVEAQYSDVLSDDSGATTSSFHLDQFVSTVKDGILFEKNSDFAPIDSMARSDADLYLFFLLGNGVLYTEPSTDAWYRSTPEPLNLSAIGAGGTSALEIYLPLEPASPMGCTDQYQFCSTAFPGTSGCGPLASLRDALAGAAPFFNTTYEAFGANYETGDTKTVGEARMLYLGNSFFAMDRSVAGMVQQAGAAALESRKRTSGVYQGGLAPDQWKRDVAYWWNMSMANAQASFIDMAYGPTDPAVLASHINFATPELQKLCSSQKIQSTGYGSFSLFGIYFTFLVGGLIAVASYLLEPISALLHKKRGFKEYAHLEWITNSTLQLQRLAHEELGVGSWANCTDDVPITKADQVIGLLDITDRKHPVLRPPYNRWESESRRNISEEAQGGRTTQEKITTVITDTDTTPKEMIRRQDTQYSTALTLINPATGLSGDERSMTISDTGASAAEEIRG
ncbi:hypothetical protein F4778DRAFT_717254 [Xylariomycetidae sp. FL2044]|nr:hypothetical protein F4778DRAFT_717254 [Xylariomycetidae sp. FL2044]